MGLAGGPEPSEGQRSILDWIRKGLENRGEISKPWSKDWPTKPGLYLFYGGALDLSDRRFQIVDVGFGYNSLVYSAQTEFLYPSQHVGVWKPFEEEVPNLEKLLTFE